MTNSASFIDLVVLDPIREHFVSGAILAVTTEDLSEIIWANAAGAQAFGNQSLVHAAGADTVFTRVQQRQILNGLHSGKANLVRVGAELVSISAQHISVAGMDAVLLSAPQSHRHHNDADQAFGMIDGLDEAQSRTAILDRNANIITATERFAALDIHTDILKELISEVATEEDRLVKRPIESAFGNIPSAIAHLNDDRFMLMAIIADDAEPELKKDVSPSVEAIKPSEPIKPIKTAISAALPLVEKPLVEEPLVEEPDNAATEIDDHASKETPIETQAAPSHDAVEASGLPTLPQNTERFVWKTDRNNIIIEASEALLTLIHTTEDALIGEEFQAVLSAQGVERAPIDALMARQDTWSGVHVDFESEAQNISVPVTLSALPQRDADNQFAGYRGFGLIRYKEARPLAAKTTEILDQDSEPSFETPEEDAPSQEEPATLALFSQDAPKADDMPEVTPTAPLTGDENTASDDNAQNDATDAQPDMAENASGDLSDKERAAFAAIRRQLTANAPGAAASVAPPQNAAATQEADQRSSRKDTGNIVTLTPKPIEPKKPDNRTEIGDTQPRFVPSAFAAIDLLPRQGNIDLVALDQLPLAIMLQRGDDIVYANDELLNLTGFDDISDIANAGGLNALFEEPESTVDHDTLNEQRAVMRLKTEGQNGLDAEAHIQVINFENSKALLLALVPLEDIADEADAASTPAPTPLNVDTALAPKEATEQNAEIDDLKAQIEELHGILDTATDGVILLDGVANIRSLNQSAEALFGYETDAVRGRPFTTLFAIESHRGAMEYLTALTDNGVASVLNDGLEVIGREQEGRFIPLFMTLGRLAGSNGYCAVLRDITQWKRAEENLNLARQDAEAASTQKSAFLARMSHEIRTPLNAIIGFSDLMLDDRFSNVKDERSKEYLKDINKSGGLVLDLVNDLLDLTKIESGEQEMEFSAVSINELLRESVSMMQPKANKQRVIIRSSLNADLPDVVADARSIKQIALNLLSNAIRFTKPGGQVIASSAILSDGCVAIRIRDTGIGMTEDEIAHAMQPYKQVKNDDVITTKEGSGLGLPLTKAMVEGNRAEMSITSTPDVGTIVEIIFPSNRVLSE